MRPSMLVLLSLFAAVDISSALLYKPEEGLTWDPSCLVWKGKYQCFFMYLSEGAKEYSHGFLATSNDGVHFIDEGVIDTESGNVVWDKCQVMVTTNVTTGKTLWILNHGASFGPYPDCPTKSQCMRFMVSDGDLHNWQHLYTMTTDPRWYQTGGRWDAMYMLQEGPGDYVGFTTATPLSGPAPGMARSSDGVNYLPVPAMQIDWVGITPVGMELGGAAKINGSYYVLVGMAGIGGNAYSIYTFKSDTGVNGTYAPDPRAFRLSGQTVLGSVNGTDSAAPYLADFALNYDTGKYMVTQYMSMPNTDPKKRSLVGGGDVWLLPLREPVIDANGLLHLGWWPGNEKLKGNAIPLAKTDFAMHAASGPTIVKWLEPTTGEFNHTEGIVFTGRFTASGTASVGFAFGRTPDPTTTVILMDIVQDAANDSGNGNGNGKTVIGDINSDVFKLRDVSGAFECGSDGTVCNDATLTYITPVQLHDFILLVRAGIFELYVDGLLVQTFTYGKYPVSIGQVGVAINGTTGIVTFHTLAAAAWSQRERSLLNFV